MSAEPTANGGAVTVSALSLTIDDLATVGTSADGPARGGDVAVIVGDLNIRGGGTISTTTSFVGQGGDIFVTAEGSALIAGIGSGIFSGGSVFASDVAPAGDIAVTAGSLMVTDFGVIQNGTTLDVAGDVVVTARESVVISSGGAILSQAFAESVGDVTISAPRLTLDNGLVQTSTIEAGNAGNILVRVGTLTLTRGGQVVASSALSATGAGGNLRIAANDVSIAGRSTGGPVSPFSLDVRSGLFSTADGQGPAGQIMVEANTIALADGATISANSTGPASALAGNVNIIFADTLSMQSSSITTESLLADGGNIAITSTGSLLHLTDSQITTSVRSGAGAGGNISLGSELHPLGFVVLANSAVRADAFGGPGGNIGIFADVYLTGGSLVSASSALNEPGRINVEARITDLSGSLVQLPENVLQAAALLRASCAARVEGKASSLVVAGREGVPPEPDGLLWSPLGVALADVDVMQDEDHEAELFPRFAGVWLGSNCTR
jgi:large exoprotein involved in heme utilization and adhesion